MVFITMATTDPVGEDLNFILGLEVRIEGEVDLALVLVAMGGSL